MLIKILQAGNVEMILNLARVSYVERYQRQVPSGGTNEWNLRIYFGDSQQACSFHGENADRIWKALDESMGTVLRTFPAVEKP